MVSNTVSFASYNMHGFDNGLAMLSHLCQQFDVILIQEHWLQISELYKLKTVNNDFTYFAVSAMDEKISSGILCGRPFGGTGILWRKMHGTSIKPIRKNANGRLITVSLFDKIMVTCVYFPCQMSSVDYTVDLSVICADLDDIIETYPNYVHLIAGDFNFEFNTNNVGYNIFNSMAEDCGIKCIDDWNDKCGHTYFHESLGHYSWIDPCFYQLSCC